jgi:uncharacterized membrane protein YkvA (DUF1232 family)
MRKRVSIGSRRRRTGAMNAARRLIREVPNLFKLVFRLLKDGEVPRLDKVLFGAVLVYMLTPVDLIPDFLGVFGWVDDFYLLGLALSRLVGSAGPELLLRHWDGDPKNLGYLVEAVDELGGGLPESIRQGLDSVADRPGLLGRLGGRKKGRRPVRRIRVDEDARVRVEE